MKILAVQGSPKEKGNTALLLNHYLINDVQYFNHYISGYPPLNLVQYKDWITKIQQMDNSFDICDCIE